MNNTKQARFIGFRRTAFAAAAAALCAGFCASANAFEIDTGNDDVQMRFDNTIRYNFGHRVEKQNPSILLNLNADDGNRNFKKGSTVTNRIDLLTEFDVVYQKKFGARVSAASWYDQAYSGGFDNTSLATSNHLVNGTPAFGLSPYANRYYNGLSGEFLDAFVFGGFDVGNTAVTVRAGRHTVNWGEALLGSGAIHGVTYAQAPLDQAKGFANPGVEAKELFLPQTQISSTIQATRELSLAGQYFFEWDATRIPEGGSYLGFNDALQFGGESLYLAPGVRAARGNDIKPKNRGDWGLAARWSPEWLDGTMGFYVRQFSDRLPQLSVMAAAPRQYFMSYADNVDMYGISLTKQIAGISFGADLNYRKNMPLNSDAVTITSLAALPTPGNVPGARGDTMHGVLNALGSLPASPLWEGGSWAAEMTWNRWLSVNQGHAFFKGRNGYTGIDRVSKDFVGLALNFTPVWYQVFPGADLSMPMSYSRGMWGNAAAVQFGGNKAAGTFAVGLGLDLYSKYRFDLKYVDYFGRSQVNPATGQMTAVNGSGTWLQDRGTVYLTFKTAF
ncbi:DUF1302 domain-containing protein [Noviherbaspirillum saxi]|uniref:DUF1302 domain-containing protein n=1 Tax=Noviherbaspirillum saxi TaxID=2320863 RepID=A0A3A3FK86_9BURK|nr:DUF1302 domain-containing protein [Noviherbaspirillum saxi]RJF95717.1 DUF1302 domain-containing protein [Noviherbaspirillum saxi]